MKLNKSILAGSLGTTTLAAMLIVVNMTGVPKAPSTANLDSNPAPIILASAHTVVPQSPSAAAAQPQSIPVPCPIWILSKIVGYGKTANASGEGAKPLPELVPGGIWLMQKFTDAARKTL